MGDRVPIESRSEFAGEGCLIQAAGVVAPFVGWYLAGIFGVALGLIALVALLVMGARKAVRYVCGTCKNPIASKEVRVCPVCRAELFEPGWLGLFGQQ